MNVFSEVDALIGEPESDHLEYKAVLPPSKNLAQSICALGNAAGGFIVIGISVNRDFTISINGLSPEFHANAITHKAIDMISPKVVAEYQYHNYNDCKLYVISVEKSSYTLSINDVVYKRIDTFNVIQNPREIHFKNQNLVAIVSASSRLNLLKINSTDSKIKYIDHCQRILKIIDDFFSTLYSSEDSNFPTSQEGRIVIRLIFSSIVDNFETYLSDLLYEIFLAKPSTLKSKQQVSLEEVLSCNDLQEFIQYYAKKKLNKLQKGSVKGFIEDNLQIKDLNVIDLDRQGIVESILQIRHLYSHRNGIIDEKFLQYFPNTQALNTEHKMSLDEILSKLDYLVDTVHLLDVQAQMKYSLSTA